MARYKYYIYKAVDIQTFQLLDILFSDRLGPDLGASGIWNYYDRIFKTSVLVTEHSEDIGGLF